jgi:hypothetical protein
MLSPLFYFISALTNSEVVLIAVLCGIVILTFGASLLGIAFAIVGRRDSVWAVTGGITSALSLLIAFFGGVFLVLELS